MKYDSPSLKSLVVDDSGGHLKKVWTSVLKGVSLSPEDGIIIGEFGNGSDSLSLDFYLADYGGGEKDARYIGSRKLGESQKIGGRKFLERSLGPVKEHSHRFGIRHRIWGTQDGNRKNQNANEENGTGGEVCLPDEKERPQTTQEGAEG